MLTLVFGISSCDVGTPHELNDAAVRGSREVSSFPDFTVELVDSFGDFDIRYVNSFPGLP